MIKIDHHFLSALCALIFGLHSSIIKAFVEQENNAITSENLTYEPLRADEELIGTALESSDILKASAPHEQDTELIEFQFQDVSLYEVAQYMGELFNLTLISNDILDPIPEKTRSLKGHRVSFRSHVALTKQEAWNLFTTFLDLSGFAIVPGSHPGVMRIVPAETAHSSPVPTFIGSPLEAIPDSDEMIRYVYYINNSSIKALEPVVDLLKSSSSQIIGLQEHNAFLIIDRANNVKSLVEIIRELDKVSLPQSLSVLRLQQADATQTKELLDELTGSKNTQMNRFSARKQPSTLYFPEDVRIIAETRTNSLILLGRKDAIAKLEDFVLRHIDKDQDKPYSPLYVYPLKYAEVGAIADILNQMMSFGSNAPIAQVGGVRGEDKYLGPMSFVPEPDSNSLIIRGDYEDYLKVAEVIRQLDEPQPQVAVEVLILTLSTIETKALGTQIRSKRPGTGLLSNAVAFQTSGLNTQAGGVSPIIENPNDPGAYRLLGDLVDALSGVTRVGSTFLTLGDKFGVWAIFQALETLVSTDILAHPFLVATNKHKARVSIGETRRVVVGTVVGAQTAQNAFGDENANLDVEVEPQINSDGKIILKLRVVIQDFLTVTDPDNVAKSVRVIETTTTLANNEVLALGGLIRNEIDNAQTNTPLIGRIPVLGWAFKNRLNIDRKDTLLVLISTRIIDPAEPGIVNSYTQGHVADYYNAVGQIYLDSDTTDPINRIWFDRNPGTADYMLDKFVKAREVRLAQKSVRSAVGSRKKRRKRAPEDPVSLEAAVSKMHRVESILSGNDLMPETYNA